MTTRKLAIAVLALFSFNVLVLTAFAIFIAAVWLAAPSPFAFAALPSTEEAASRPVNYLVVGDFSTAVRDVSKKVRPAVVQITNEQVGMDQFNQGLSVPAGVGSGVIYDSQGHILTNNHVIEGASKLTVSLPDGRSFQGKLIGADPETDLAVVQIEGTSLPIAQFGDSSQLEVGDWVVAIGNALALDGGPTVTAGVVSALGRTVQEPSDTADQGPFLFGVIQTDAPINPGNSGGPLVNLAGQVVGINTMIATQADAGTEADGIGFAISVEVAKPIADQLVETGRVIHPTVDFNYVPLNPTISAQLGVQRTDGVVVVRVPSGSVSDQAGLKRGDIITEVDGVALQGDSALALVISIHKPGDTMKLTVLRGADTVSVLLTLGSTASN